MTQHNLTQILKVIRDLVMRNRPCYRDYLGSETVTNTVQIGSGVFEGFENSAKAQFIATDSSFTGFVLGETYTVTIDGVTEDYVARNLSPVSEEIGPIIGTITTYNIDDKTFDGWLAAAAIDIDSVLCAAQTHDMSFVGKTISISQTRTETITHYNTKLLPEYLLPAFLRKNVVATKTEVQRAADKAADAASGAQNAANGAQVMASAAQSTANTAKSTADEAKTKAINAYTKASIAETTANAAQTTANSAKNLADAALTPSRSDFSTNACAYYANNPYDNDAPVYFYIGGTSFLRILVNKASSVVKINPPVNMNAQADFEFSRLTSAYPHPKIKGIGGIVMHSSTSGSTKQFLITVDDTGTLKATEVT